MVMARGYLPYFQCQAVLARTVPEVSHLSEKSGVNVPGPRMLAMASRDDSEERTEVPN